MVQDACIITQSNGQAWTKILPKSRYGIVANGTAYKSKVKLHNYYDKECDDGMRNSLPFTLIMLESFAQ